MSPLVLISMVVLCNASERQVVELLRKPYVAHGGDSNNHPSSTIRNILDTRFWKPSSVRKFWATGSYSESAKIARPCIVLKASQLQAPLQADPIDPLNKWIALLKGCETLCKSEGV
jgi:hypothetical protein